MHCKMIVPNNVLKRIVSNALHKKKNLHVIITEKKIKKEINKSHNMAGVKDRTKWGPCFILI